MIRRREENAAFGCGDSVNPRYKKMSLQILKIKDETYAFNNPLKLSVLPSFSVAAAVVLSGTVGAPVDFESRDVERVKAASRSSRRRMHRCGIRPIS